MPEITETRFGTISFTEEDVITFEEGLIGFPSCRSFLCLSRKPDSPFRWLQSVEEPALAFLVADPYAFVDDYLPEIEDQCEERLGLGAETPAMVFATASIPHGKPEEMTLNLAGPIVINAETRCGRQFVVDDEAYTIKHRVHTSGGGETLRAAA